MNSSSKKYFCGPFYFPIWLKRILSKRFNESCYIHDKSYDEMKQSRKSVDITFLRNMISTSNSVYTAFIFFIAVRLFGWISWRHKK